MQDSRKELQKTGIKWRLKGRINNYLFIIIHNLTMYKMKTSEI